MDTLVDPVEEIASSSHLPVAPRVDGARASLPTLDPEVQVQWFSRPPAREPAQSVDIDIEIDTAALDEEGDTEPTLVLRRQPPG